MANMVPTKSRSGNKSDALITWKSKIFALKMKKLCYFKKDDLGLIKWSVLTPTY